MALKRLCKKTEDKIPLLKHLETSYRETGDPLFARKLRVDG